MNAIDEAPAAADALRDKIIAQLRTVHDPEIPVNIYDLGLIYRIDLIEDGDAHRAEIDMTLTTPNCPVAETMPGLVRYAVENVAGLSDVTINLVWEPPWDRSRMSEDAQLALNMF